MGIDFCFRIDPKVACIAIMSAGLVVIAVALVRKITKKPKDTE